MGPMRIATQSPCDSGSVVGGVKQGSSPFSSSRDDQPPPMPSASLRGIQGTVAGWSSAFSSSSCLAFAHVSWATVSTAASASLRMFNDCDSRYALISSGALMAEAFLQESNEESYPFHLTL